LAKLTNGFATTFVEGAAERSANDGEERRPEIATHRVESVVSKNTASRIPFLIGTYFDFDYFGDFAWHLFCRHLFCLAPILPGTYFAWHLFCLFCLGTYFAYVIFARARQYAPVLVLQICLPSVAQRLATRPTAALQLRISPLKKT
jgi:hypothetical protein